MVLICDNKTVERILKFLRRDKHNSEKRKLSNVNLEIKHDLEHHPKICQNIKERVANIIKENEKYFISEISRTTIDTIIYNDGIFLERLKSKGYSQRIAVEIFEKYGIFLYVTDLCGYVYAKKSVREGLYSLIEEYGIEKVAEEIAIYLRENHSDKLGINMISIQ